jgi:hypothetical protein
MAPINRDLAAKIRKRLGIGRSRLYQLIQDKVSQTKLERRLAAIVLATESGLSIEQFASSEDLATIRGASKAAPTTVSAATAQTTALKKVIKIDDPLKIDLEVVSNEGLRKILRRDILELNVARSQGYDKTPKTCMILAGAIVEAMLLDALKRRKKAALKVASNLPQPPPANLEEWNLYQMVQVASGLKPRLLPADSESGADQLRKWRNLVHPGRELRDSKAKRIKPSAARARNAVAFLQFVADELRT